MIRLGLTGSIATGKSTTAKMFKNRGIAIYDADKAVHQLYENEAVEPMKDLYPQAILNGKIDRTALGKIVLNDKEKLSALEKLIHPLVHQKMHQFIDENAKTDADLIVLEIPLLFETGKDYPLDKIAVTYCAADIQKQRALARDGMTEQKFNAILSRQMPQDEKRSRADFAINTGMGIKQTQMAVDEIISACGVLAKR